MEVDTATSSVQTPAKHLLPELEIYCYLLFLLFLIDQKKYNEVGFVFMNLYYLFPLLVKSTLLKCKGSFVLFSFRLKLVPQQVLIGSSA